MLISKKKGLSIHVIKRLKLAVFTWKGFTPSDVFREGTIRSLETLREFPIVNRIIINTKEHSIVMMEDLDASVQSTVAYLGVARESYKVAVIPPEDIIAKGVIDWYVDSLNETLKKRFVVRKYETMKHAFYGLIFSKIWWWLGIKLRGRQIRKKLRVA